MSREMSENEPNENRSSENELNENETSENEARSNLPLSIGVDGSFWPAVENVRSAHVASFIRSCLTTQINDDIDNVDWRQ